MGIDNILNKIQQIEHGYQHILDGANEILSAYSEKQCFELALTLFEHEAYQARMLATTILGKLATEDNNAL
ncbi:MAG: HEAT repeat domain-containing protein, partial [Prevotellaceae bacterium]|nr:HEAT repeat domain-containing protein [Prevotellaceae bacterium]